MLNPNYDADLINDDHEQIVENNHLKLIININGTESGARGCSSNSSSIDDHCHVSVSLENKDRNKTVWYKLITVFILCVMFMIGEIIGGILAKSISIQTDAAHMAADIAGFFFSILAIYVSEKGILLFGSHPLKCLNSKKLTYLSYHKQHYIIFRHISDRFLDK